MTSQVAGPIGQVQRPRRDPTAALPEYPWDALAPAKATAAAHPDGIIDMSIGTPVDRVPNPARIALAGASDAPGYPQVHGTTALRQAYTDWLARAHGIVDLDPANVLPTIGSKELIAALPAQLGFGPEHTIVIPELAYPTYEVGVRMAGAGMIRADSLTAIGPEPVSMIWLNSPSNPTGKVLPAEHLAKVVGWARARGIIVVSDECYIDLGWDLTPLSILHPDVCGGDHTGLLAVHSLSKRSNFAGYRVGFVSGDPALVDGLLQVRKHTGFMVPTPIQAAAAAALGDDGHALAQRGRYAARRQILTAALERAGFTVDESAGGLYLWCSRDAAGTGPGRSGSAAKADGADWAMVEWLAQRGILVAPGSFYGPTGSGHVRIALTVSDERVAAVAVRLVS